jgi:hypothetical protein
VIDLFDEKGPLLQNSGINIISFMLIRHSKLVQKYLLEPIQLPLLPLRNQSTEIISTDESIERALRRLEVIISNPSSPTLISLLFQPLLLNLFLLSVYTSSTFHTKVKSQVTQLLASYFTASSSAATDAIHLIEEIVQVPADEGWTYAPGDEGGIVIRRVTIGDTHEYGFEEISNRVSVIVEILRETSNDVKSEIFVGIVRHWLSPYDENPLQYEFLITKANFSGHLRLFNYYKTSCRIIKLNYSSLQSM